MHLPTTHLAIYALSIFLLLKFTTATKPSSFELINYTNTTYSYCSSPNHPLLNTTLSTTSTLTKNAHNLCITIPDTVQLNPANAKTKECSCEAWEYGVATWKACNCNSCAGLELGSLRKSCFESVDGCLGSYEGAYHVKFGEGKRGFVAVHRYDAFERPEVEVGCAKKEEVEELGRVGDGVWSVIVPTKEERKALRKEAAEDKGSWFFRPASLVDAGQVKELYALAKSEKKQLGKWEKEDKEKLANIRREKAQNFFIKGRQDAEREMEERWQRIKPVRLEGGRLGKGAQRTDSRERNWFFKNELKRSETLLEKEWQRQKPQREKELLEEKTRIAEEGKKRNEAFIQANQNDWKAKIDAWKKQKLAKKKEIAAKQKAMDELDAWIQKDKERTKMYEMERAEEKRNRQSEQRKKQIEEKRAKKLEEKKKRDDDRKAKAAEKSRKAEDKKKWKAQGKLRKEEERKRRAAYKERAKKKIIS